MFLRSVQDLSLKITGITFSEAFWATQCIPLTTQHLQGPTCCLGTLKPSVLVCVILSHIVLVMYTLSVAMGFVDYSLRRLRLTVQRGVRLLPLDSKQLKCPTRQRHATHREYVSGELLPLVTSAQIESLKHTHGQPCSGSDNMITSFIVLVESQM